MILVVGLVIAFVLSLIFPNRKTRLCRWRESRAGEQSTWRCISCGARTTGPKGQAPETCFRPDPR